MGLFEAFFGKSMTPQERLKKNQRALERAQRELEREKRKLACHTREKNHSRNQEICKARSN